MKSGRYQHSGGHCHLISGAEQWRLRQQVPPKTITVYQMTWPETSEGNIVEL
jgi:hypothetical protein